MITNILIILLVLSIDEIVFKINLHLSLKINEILLTNSFFRQLIPSVRARNLRNIIVYKSLNF